MRFVLPCIDHGIPDSPVAQGVEQFVVVHHLSSAGIDDKRFLHNFLKKS